MLFSRISSKLQLLLTVGVTLILLATLLSCGGDPILNPRNVDPEDEASQDDSEQDPDQSDGGLSINHILGPTQGPIVFLS